MGFCCHFDRREKSFFAFSVTIMPAENRYYVYLMTNWNHRVIYVGVTNDLARRLYEHKNKLVKGFTEKYNVNKLVYFEETADVRCAIARERDQEMAETKERCTRPNHQSGVERSFGGWERFLASLEMTDLLFGRFVQAPSQQD
jgi:predicted GIY-YIG superfamily endonuclease